MVCHQLGYPDAVGGPLSSHYGQGTGPIWINGVECLGNESDLFACAHNKISNHSCEHDQDASVECLGMPTLYVLKSSKSNTALF